MQLEPGMRVRCVVAPDGGGHLTKGAEYTVWRLSRGARYVYLVGIEGNWQISRFKPIVRVKAKCVPTLDLLIKRAIAAVDRMTPAEKDAMHKAQRESWARGEMALSARHIFAGAGR